MRLTSRLHLADLCCLAYLLAGVLLLAVYRPGGWLPRGILYAALGGAIVLIGIRDTAPGRSRAWNVAAALYPVALVAFAWGELRLLIPLPWEEDYWATRAVVEADRGIFGGYPTVIVQAWHRPWLDELMAVAYVSYYLFLGVPLFLLLVGRIRAARATGALIALTYTVNFGLFILLPVKSPPQILEQVPGLEPSLFTGYVFADLLRSLQASASVVGAAFPSSHVAGAVVCALAALRWAPPLGRVLLPLAGGMAAATVYLGYHHAVDPIAGIVWGILAYAIGIDLMRRRRELPGDRT